MKRTTKRKTNRSSQPPAKRQAPAPRRAPRIESGEMVQRHLGRDLTVLERSGMGIANFSIRANSVQDVEGSGEITFEAVIASETPCPRRAWSWDEGIIVYSEILSMAGADLARANPLPMLRDHDMYEVTSRIGSWTNLRVEGTELVATGTVRGDDDVATIRSMLRAGHLDRFSIGYSVNEYEDESEEDSDEMILRAVSWSLIEASAVSVPADHTAVMRAIEKLGGRSMARRRGNQAGSAAGQRSLATGGQRAHDEQLQRNQEEIEGNGTENDADGDDVDGDADGSDDDEEDDDADDVVVQDEGSRRLRQAARNAGIPETFLSRYAGRATAPTVEQLLSDHAEYRASQSSRSRSIGMTGNPYGGNAPADGRRALVIANAAATFRGVDVPENARSIGRMTPFDLYTQVCRSRGVRAPSRPGFAFAHMEQMRSEAPMVIADFNHLLVQIADTIMIEELRQTPFAGEGWTREVELDNFLTYRSMGVASYDPLLETEEGAEVQSGGVRIFDTEMKLASLKRKYVVSRELMESDNGGHLFTDMVGGIAEAGMEGRNIQLARRFRTNPLMSDGDYFWTASPRVDGRRRFVNVGENMAITVENMNVAQAALMGPNTSQLVTWIGVHPLRNVEAAAIANRTSVGTDQPANPFGGQIRVVLIPTLPVDAWIVGLGANRKSPFLALKKTGQARPQIKNIVSDSIDGMTAMAYWDTAFAFGNPEGAYLAWIGDAPDTLDGQATNYGL